MPNKWGFLRRVYMVIERISYLCASNLVHQHSVSLRDVDSSVCYRGMRFYCEHFVVATFQDFLRTHQFPRLADWFIHERLLSPLRKCFFYCSFTEICNEVHLKTMWYLLRILHWIHIQTAVWTMEVSIDKFIPLILMYF